MIDSLQEASSLFVSHFTFISTTYTVSSFNMSTAAPVTIVGATGLTGSASLKQLLASKTAFDITTIARKAINTPAAANPATQYSHVLVEDLFEVPKSDQIIAKAGSTYVSALGTTRGSAGSFEAQEKIDVTLNVDMAKRAKEQGAERVSLHLYLTDRPRFIRSYRCGDARSRKRELADGEGELTP